MTVVDASAVIEAHRRSGRRFTAAGIGSFVREEGSGEPVVCLHGVPASSFLYRKVVTELASRGLRGIAFDLPGLGLADRPVVADYTWTGLGRFASAAVDALGLERFHWSFMTSAGRWASRWLRPCPTGSPRSRY